MGQSNILNHHFPINLTHPAVIMKTINQNRSTHYPAAAVLHRKTRGKANQGCIFKSALINYTPYPGYGNSVIFRFLPQPPQNPYIPNLSLHKFKI